MPRIRKKTSNRAGTHDRAKLRHKIVDGRKKNRKLAKKNPQWKSRVPKDPGIPNSFPFKEQILTEIAAERRKVEEEKQARKVANKKSKKGKTGGDDDDDEEEPDNEVDDARNGLDGVTALRGAKGQSAPSKAALKAQALAAAASAVTDEEEAPLLFDPSLPDLKAALAHADIVLHVLDARDPLPHRSTFIEGLAKEQNKQIVYLLNKIDLCPKESVVSWLEHLRASHPTFPFRVSSALLPPPEDGKGKAKTSETDGLGVDALVSFFTQQSSAKKSTDKTRPFSVAVVGLPNSGKSAVINTLCQHSRLSIYKPDAAKETPTTTTLPQPVTLEKDGLSLQFIDTPGFAVVPSTEDDVDETVARSIQVQDMLLKSRGKIEKTKQPEVAAFWLVSRAKQEDLMLHYNTPAYLASDPNGFLSGHARATGRLKRGGVLDLIDSARSVLRDFRVGKFPYYTTPPTTSPTTTSTPSSPALTTLYTQTDEQTLPHLRSRKDMRNVGGLIRLSAGTIDERIISLDAPAQPVEKEARQKVKKVKVSLEGSEDEAESSEEEEDELDEDEEEEEEEEEEPIPVPTKRKRPAPSAARAPPAKKVSFAKKAAPAASATKSTTTATTTLPSAIKPKPKTRAAAPKVAKVAPKVSNVGKKRAATEDKGTAGGKEGEAYDFGKYF